jgi:hypothetical protein
MRLAVDVDGDAGWLAGDRQRGRVRLVNGWFARHGVQAGARKAEGKQGCEQRAGRPVSAHGHLPSKRTKLPEHT